MTATPIVQVPLLSNRPTSCSADPDDNGRWLRLRDVKFASGKTFGWRIRLPCLQPVEYTEVMKLPAKGDFTFDPQELRETTISADGTVATTLDYAACFDGWIEHSWTPGGQRSAGPVGDLRVAVPRVRRPSVWRVNVHEVAATSWREPGPAAARQPRFFSSGASPRRGSS